MAKRKSARRKTRKRTQIKAKPVRRISVDKNTAIGALIFNIIVPGIGTLIMGKIRKGVIQLILYLIGLFLAFTYVGLIVGIPLMTVVWIWALVTGIKAVRNSY